MIPLTLHSDIRSFIKRYVTFLVFTLEISTLCELWPSHSCLTSDILNDMGGGVTNH